MAPIPCSPIPCSRGVTEAFARRFLARIPPEVAATFSPEQLRAVQRVFGMRYAQEHTVDVRRSVPLPWGRYYLVFLAGRDRPGEGSAGMVLTMALLTLAVGLGAAALLV